MREPSYEHHPVEDLEPLPESEYREMAIRCLAMMRAMRDHIRGARSLDVGLTAVEIAMGWHDKSIAFLADKLRIERATLSASARIFAAKTTIPISMVMRSPAASASYSAARKRTLKPPCKTKP
jgi:hypothetical protein